MTESKYPQLKKEQTPSTSAEGQVAYNLSWPETESSSPTKSPSDKLSVSSQLAATKEGEGIPQPYLDKIIEYVNHHLEPKLANIEEKFLSLKSDFQIRTESIQHAIEQTLAEMRDRDNQRHLEIMNMQSSIDAKLESVDRKFIQLEDKMDAKFEAVDRKFTQLEDKMDAKFERMDDKISKVDDKVDNVNRWMVGLVIGTFLSIAGMILTIYLTFLTLIKV